MTRNQVKNAHAVAGTLGFVIILGFFSATVVAEWGGDLAVVTAVKRFIAYGLVVLIPAMMAAGVTGARLSGRSQARLVRFKKRRMAIAAANGMLVLAPCALVLHGLARSGSFGPAFYMVQGLELIAGPVNIVLMALNIRDGLALSGRRRKKRPA